MKGIEKDVVIEFVKENFSEMLGGLCVMVLVMLLMFMRKQYVITVLGCIGIGAIAYERRAKVFDRTVSILVVFALAVGFMLFD
jgi:hypothetical protein